MLVLSNPLPVSAMSLPLKILLALSGLIFTTVIGAVIYITVVFDPNDYRDEINTAAQDATGRELIIAGDLELKLFPWVGVSVNQLALTNAEGFGPEPMLEVGELQARVELMPLLTENAVRIGEVRLQDVVVRAAVRDETNNWDDIPAHQEARQAEAEAAPDAPPPPEEDTNIIVEVGGEEHEPMDVAIAGITLRNIRVEYDADGDLSTLQLDTLQTGPIRLGEPSTLLVELSASLPEGLAATVKLQSGWQVDPESQLVNLSELELLTTVSGPTVPGGEQSISAKGMVQYNASQGTAKIPAIEIQTGTLAATLKADITTTEAGANGTIGLSTNQFIAQDIAGQLGIPLGNGEGNQPTALNIALALSPNSVRSTTLEGLIDGAPLSGNFAVENFDAPRVRSSLELKAFTLEHWTPPASEEASAPTEDDTAEDPMASELPLEMVKDLDLDVTVLIGSFSGSGIRAKNVTWTAFSRPGQPFRQELAMQAYGGEIRAKNKIDARGTSPKTGLVLDLQAVGLGDLLEGTLGEAYVTGLTQMTLNVDSVGSTLKSMLASAVGAAQYTLQDGSVSGISLLDLINTGVAKLDGSKAASSGEKQRTEFQKLAGKLVFSGGRANAQSLDADNSLMSLKGKGGIDLEQLKWDLDLSPRLKDHPRIREQRQLKNLIDIDIPLRVSGPLLAPKLKLDVEGALKARAQQEIDAKKGELKAKAEDKVEKEINRQLDKLFGKKDKKKKEQAD